jgi:hypothetical protein
MEPDFSLSSEKIYHEIIPVELQGQEQADAFNYLNFTFPRKNYRYLSSCAHLLLSSNLPAISTW